MVWEMVKENSLTPADVRAGLTEVDRVLGLGFTTHDEKLDSLSNRPVAVSALPSEIQELIAKRDAARSRRDWSTADSLRSELDSKGYEIDDTMEGTKIFKK